MHNPLERNPYWDARHNLLYYQVVRQLIDGLAENAESMLDVGSHGCPYLDWYRQIPVRVSIDLEQPFSGAGITSVRADFLRSQLDRRFDIITCLQVLEHVSEPTAFARKLLATGQTVIVSVPHAWPPGSVGGHLHDPVTARKMRKWFGREPNFSYICHEVLTRSDRLIQVYEPGDIIWSNLAKRAKLRAARPAPDGVPPSSLARFSRSVRKSALPRLARRYWLQLRYRLLG